MFKDQLVQRFLTRFILQPPRCNIDYSTTKQAAILIPIISSCHQEAVIILTKRAAHLTTHPGEIAYPGGKAESYDHSIIDTALRESYEEIGLATQCVKILGQLPNMNSRDGLSVTPIVGLIQQPVQLSANPDEVETIIEIPLKEILNLNRYSTVDILFKQKLREIVQFSYQQHFIWGLTAKINFLLAQQVNFDSMMSKN